MIMNTVGISLSYSWQRGYRPSAFCYAAAPSADSVARVTVTAVDLLAWNGRIPSVTRVFQRPFLVLSLNSTPLGQILTI